MAKTAIMVGIISIIMIQSVSGAPMINYNRDRVRGTVRGKLEVKGSATNLEDRDSWTAGQSDPYMEVVAKAEGGNIQTSTTPVRGGTNNPTWDDYLVFNSGPWISMEICIMDYDGDGREPDPLCGPNTSISISINATSDSTKLSVCTLNVHNESTCTVYNRTKQEKSSYNSL